MEKDGATMIAEERARQVEKEGWDADHDKQHSRQELLWAAVAYVANAMHKLGVKEGIARVSYGHKIISYEDVFPRNWLRKYDKRSKHGTIRSLTIAGALIAAEIDRLHRMGVKE